VNADQGPAETQSAHPLRKEGCRLDAGYSPMSSSPTMLLRIGDCQILEGQKVLGDTPHILGALYYPRQCTTPHECCLDVSYSWSHGLLRSQQKGPRVMVLESGAIAYDTVSAMQMSERKSRHCSKPTTLPLVYSHVIRWQAWTNDEIAR
jgi:hypothetical protein